MPNHAIQSNYIKQVKILVAGLKHASKEEDLALISKYETLIAELLTSLQGKKVNTELRIELNKLKAQHQLTSTKVAEMLEQVKGELTKYKKNKKRMAAYTPASTTHIKIKA